jgi:hypothetical protein
MPVIPVNRVVDTKRIIEKMEGRGGEELRGTDPPPRKKKVPTCLTYIQMFFFLHTGISETAL